MIWYPSEPVIVVVVSRDVGVRTWLSLYEKLVVILSIVYLNSGFCEPFFASDVLNDRVTFSVRRLSRMTG